MKRLILSTFALFIALMANAADYDFTYEFYNGVKIYCKITKAATSTKTSGRGEITIVGGTGPSGSELFIDLIDYNGYSYKPTAIGERAFDGATWIKKLYLTNYITSVGDYAFCHCTNLTNITINQGVTFGKGEFYGCTSLVGVNIPQGITTIPDECFAYCSDLQYLNIGREVTTIGYRAFYHCCNLVNLVVPETVTSLGKQCFAESGDDAFSTIEIRCDVVNEAFINMNYRYVTLAETIKNFDVGSLSSLIMEFYIYSDAVTNQNYTSDSNLCYCSLYYRDRDTCITMLRNVVIGGKVETIGQNAFNSSNLWKLSVDIEDDFSILRIEEGVKYIGSDAFASQSKLGNVTLPSTIISIGKSAFWYCRPLNNIYMPESLESITIDTYGGCHDVNTIFAKTAKCADTLAQTEGNMTEQAQVYAFSKEIYDAYVKAGFKNVILMGGSSSVKEDVNEDGQVNSLDVLKVYKYMQSH